MKTSKRRSTILDAPAVARARKTQQEIENFLHALSSYPDRFARDPYLSFEQHLFSIATASPLSTVGGERRRTYGR